MANVHNLDQRKFIVRKIAAFEPPRAIAADFCVQFPDTKCDENDVRRLDRDSGAMLSPELHALFNSEREGVLLDPTAATFANQMARLILLSNQVKFYSGNNQLAEARAVMRQIAEETGVVGGKPGKVEKPADGDPQAPVIEIVRRIVYPKGQEPNPEPEAVA